MCLVTLQLDIHVLLIHMGYLPFPEQKDKGSVFGGLGKRKLEERRERDQGPGCKINKFKLKNKAVSCQKSIHIYVYVYMMLALDF